MVPNRCHQKMSANLLHAYISWVSKHISCTTDIESENPAFSCHRWQQHVGTLAARNHTSTTQCYQQDYWIWSVLISDVDLKSLGTHWFTICFLFQILTAKWLSNWLSYQVSTFLSVSTHGPTAAEAEDWHCGGLRMDGWWWMGDHGWMDGWLDERWDRWMYMPPKY